MIKNMSRYEWAVLKEAINKQQSELSRSGPNIDAHNRSRKHMSEALSRAFRKVEQLAPEPY